MIGTRLFQRGIVERGAARVLWPLARLYSLGANVRAEMYRSGRWKQQRLKRPVVSVGNLSVGGTGKTPLVAWLHAALAARGLKASVLTRGYQRSDRRPVLVLDSAAGASRVGGAGMVGDEVQLFLRHGIAPVGVAARRFDAGTALEAGHSVDLHLIDDGFQHLELARDLDIVTIDTTRPPWHDDLLPAGRLREPPAALARADIIVLTRVQKWTAVDSFVERLKQCAPRADVFRAQTRLIDPEEPAREAPLVRGPVLAFAGLGNQRAFFADLCVAGVQVVESRAYPDHHRYSVRDLLRLEARARQAGADALVTSEKDAMNLPREYRRGLQLPLRVVGMSLEIENGEALAERVAAVAAREPVRP